MTPTQTAIRGCTGKRRYASEVEAIRAAIKVSAKWGKPMRTYRCGNHWHLTSEIR
jgi:hypothetical protein